MSVSVVGGPREAALLSVTGVVQGVGFRPFVHRLAQRHGLSGWVRNDSAGVRIRIEGAPEDLTAFTLALRTESPPLAQIDAVERQGCALEGLTDFVIGESEDEPDRRQPVSPDVAVCAACLAELCEPTDRRYRYPFVTCTNCGPRYTVIEGMPYDRERTSMRVFAQCAACLGEYHTLGDRRYHSETNSCPSCGPRVWLEASDGTVDPGPDPIAEAARLLIAGAVVAVRGLGGFHCAADAANDVVVDRLRVRKRRDAKPLAVMVRTVAEAQALGHVSWAEEAALQSPERPIVLLRRRADGAALAAALAPGLDTVGVMLAYTPIHHLLLEQVGRPLVMTSGNASEEPIAVGNAEARHRLAGIADAFLLHDREIVARYDDSVVRLAGDSRVFLRRARGYAPLPLDLPVASSTPLVAVGAHLKSTFTLVHGPRAFVSQHLGDLETLETLDHFRTTLDAYKRLFRIEPEVAVRDRHPGYLSSRIADELGLQRVIAVQHHHAHIAAVLAEHGLADEAVGVACDGTGYGDDGHVWGCEVLIADLTRARRVAHLRYAALPGGDLAVRMPWRAALGYLALEPAAAGAFAAAFEGVSDRERSFAAEQIAHHLNAPLASSLGRLFDAAAAILGVRRVAQYEGQAAMELESLAAHDGSGALPFPLVDDGDGTWQLDPLPLLAGLGERRLAGVDLPALAAAFHESVARGLAAAAARAAAVSGTRIVALGGGCFQNARLLTSVRAKLEAQGVVVLIPHRLGPNDGAVSYGQAAVAAALLRQEG